ncbi:MAG: beta strand repeat-containing protein [Patescibacteria group bacterium]
MRDVNKKNLKSLMILNQRGKNKLTPSVIVFNCAVFLLLAIVFPKAALAQEIPTQASFPPHEPEAYQKLINATLTSFEWNNLLSDFVNTWQPTYMTGPLGIGTTNAPSDSGPKLTLFGANNTLRFSYDSSNYADISAGIDGRLQLSPKNGRLYLVGPGISNSLFIYDYSETSQGIYYYSALSAQDLYLNYPSKSVRIGSSGISWLAGGDLYLGATSSPTSTRLYVEEEASDRPAISTGFRQVAVYTGPSLWYHLTNKEYVDNNFAAKGSGWELGGNTLVAKGLLGSLNNQDIGLIASGTERLTIKADTGNIGIGTTNPQQQLQLTGSLRLPVTTSTTTGVIYKDGSPFIHDFKPSGRDGYNVFVGMNSGNFTMRGSSSTHGSYNTAVGANTLTSITEGRYNTAIGYLALTNLTTGLQSTAVGSRALQSNTSGYKNQAFGDLALSSNETGYQNVAIGGSSLGDNIDGNDNSALGHGALVSHKTGNSNTGVGVYSLYYQTSGTGNVGIGLHAGSRLADNKATRTAGNYGVYIGANSKASADRTNNEIVIGYNAIGAGSNTVVLGSDSITKTILKGNIGIGTTSPQAALDVDGLIKMRNYTFTQPEDVVNKGYVDGIVLPTATSTVGTQSGFWTLGNNNNIYNNNTLGNVGIGTSDPNSKLVVSNGTGELRFGGSNGRTISAYTGSALANIDYHAVATYFNSHFILASKKEIQMYDYGGGRSGYGRIHIPSSENLTFFLDGANRMVIAPGGNVGIGTVSPSTMLHVVGTGGQSTIDAGGGYVSNMAIVPTDRDQAVSFGFLEDNYSATSTQYWRLNGNNVYVADNSWNVGIGTTNANGARLNVDGSVLALDYIFRNNPNIKITENYGLRLSGDSTHPVQSPTASMLIGYGASGGNYGTNNLLVAGSLGVGVTSPRGKLDVTGAVDLGGDTGNVTAVLGSGYNHYTYFGGTKAGRIRGSNEGYLVLEAYPTGTNATINFYTNNSSRMKIGYDGNIGIGIFSPQYKLDVNGSARFNNTVIVATPTADDHAATKAYVDAAILPTSTPYVGEQLGFWTGGSNNSIYNANVGNVGIGIGAIDPVSQLSVYGDTGNLLTIRNSASNSYTAMAFRDNRDNNSYKFQVGVYGSSYASPNTSNAFLYNTAGGGIGFYAGTGNPANDLRLLLTKGGNVGIGTASPSTMLHVVGTGGQNTINAGKGFIGGLDLTPTEPDQAVPLGYLQNNYSATSTQYWNKSGSNVYVADSDWKIGIGTTVPSAMLTVASSSSIPALKLNGSGTYGSGFLATIGNYGTLSQASSGNNFITWGAYNSGSTWVRSYGGNISGLVNISIGNGDMLSIQTDHRASPDSPVFSDVLKIKGRSVSIATSTTESTVSLLVDGAGYFSNVVTVGTPTASGHAATKAYVDAAILPTSTPYVGEQLGFWVGGSNNSIYNANLGNVGIGTTNPQQQLQLTGSLRLPVTTSATTGVIYKDGSPFIHDFKPSGRDGYNVFVGMNSGNFTMRGSSSDHGSYNVAVGANTLSSLTSGRKNVAVGNQALESNTEGQLNTGVGHLALQVNTTGYNNQAFGYGALFRNATGSTNVAIGGLALGNNISGSGNSALGHGAVSENKTGSSNTGVGAYSLLYQVSGSGNVGVGTNAGSKLADDITKRTTGNYGVYIGANTKSLANGASNEIVIGYNAIGNGSSTATFGNSFMKYHFFPAGDVYIGTTTLIGTSSKLVVWDYESNKNMLTFAGTGHVRGLDQTPFGDDYAVPLGYLKNTVLPGLTWLTNGNYLNAKRVLGSTNSEDIGFITSGTERMTITASGNIGIGTTNPQAKLQVEGGLVLKTTYVNNANYTAKADDYIIAYSAINAHRTVYLPDSLCQTGRFFVIMDQSGSSTPATTITIQPSTSGSTPSSNYKIIGRDNFVISNPYNAVYVFCGQNQWFLL